jgi:hypothetical protein
MAIIIVLAIIAIPRACRAWQLAIAFPFPLATWLTSLPGPLSHVSGADDGWLRRCSIRALVELTRHYYGGGCVRYASSITADNIITSLHWGRRGTARYVLNCSGIILEVLPRCIEERSCLVRKSRFDGPEREPSGDPSRPTNNKIYSPEHKCRSGLYRERERLYTLVSF